MMKRILLLLLVCTFLNTLPTKGQTPVSLEECMKMALNQSPIQQQKAYYATIETLKTKQAANNYLPQLSLNGQASYQSDVLSFPENPVFEAPEIPKDQYKATIDLQQLIYDGGLVKNQKATESANIAIQQASVDVNLYQVISVVHQLYFSILSLQNNERILHTRLELLQQQKKTMESRVQHGVLLPSDLKQFTKQILNTEQSIEETQNDEKAYREILASWTGNNMDDATLEETPGLIASTATGFTRPELNLYKSQSHLYESLSDMASVERRPTLSLFAQGGYGSPNPFNYFETDFNEFYMIGLRLNWKILDYGNVKKEHQINALQQQITNTNQQQFEDDISRQLIEEEALQRKLTDLLHKDQEILSLQQDIVKSAYAQLNNGTITPVDYLDQLNEQTSIELQQNTHEIQFQKSKYQIKIINGRILNSLKNADHE